ncbi:PspC domain-containing protein [Nocardioides aequoreus]|uniref:PspC domain-containing protein n=1 Tax=Nocardioides aequoreus TaxID=397278 RepID=UPI0004C319E6|nr:PspC domain-containing protein [Nocardioides aequoreus]
MSDPQQIPGGPSYKRLVRTDGPVSGVCGGLAAYVGLDPTLVRVVVAVALIFTFPLGLLAYAVLWAVMPRS